MHNQGRRAVACVCVCDTNCNCVQVHKQTTDNAVFKYRLFTFVFDSTSIGNRTQQTAYVCRSASPGFLGIVSMISQYNKLVALW